jgi:hypothetical protein
MTLRLLAIALCAIAFALPASAQTPDLATIARSSGTPDIPGLSGLAGAVGRRCKSPSLAQHHRASDRRRRDLPAAAQNSSRTRRGAASWSGVETDGTVYWAVAGHLVPTHGDGGNRNDNKYIDNGPTFHRVVGNNSVGVEFAGIFPT